MDKIVSKLASVSTPALVLLVAMDATGYAGAATFTTALASLGPCDMISGAALLLMAGAATQGISEFGFDSILPLLLRS